MADFKGKNSTKSVKQLMYDRSQYGLYAFPENKGLGPDNVLDFNFAERVLYGKVDRQHNAVVPRREYIFVVRDSNNKNSTISAMNFVADQFNDLQEHFFRATQMGLISFNDPVLSQMVATRGYSDPYTEYSNYISGLMSEYINEFLYNRREQIINFEDFMIHLVHFLSHKGPDSPITFSGFLRSKRSDIFGTGLAIDIAGLPFHDDELTGDVLLNRGAFSFYLNLARQYGFSLSKRNPGLLVSNIYALFEDNLIGEPVNKYRARYPRLTSLDNLFAEQFTRAINLDLQELKPMLLTYYNLFVNRNKIHNTVYYCGKFNKTSSKVIYRKEINYDILNEYNNNIIYLYINIRNIEERTPFNKNEVEGLYDQSLVNMNISESRMLENLDFIFKSKFMNKKGSLTYHKKRLRKSLDNQSR